MKVSYGPAAVKDEQSRYIHCMKLCGKDDDVMMPESEDLPFCLRYKNHGVWFADWSILNYGITTPFCRLVFGKRAFFTALYSDMGKSCG